MNLKETQTWRAQLLILCFGTLLLVSDGECAGRRTRNEVFGGGLKSRRRCISYDDTVGTEVESSSGTEADSSAVTVTEMVCTKDSQFCYALWRYTDNGTVEYIKQGCWEAGPETENCQNSQCVSNKLSKSRRGAGTKGELEGQGPDTTTPEVGAEQAEPQQQRQSPPLFCCCGTDNCNVDVEVTYVEPGDDPEESSEESDLLRVRSVLGGGSASNLAVGLVFFCASVIFGVILLAGGYRYWKKVSNRRTRKEGADGNMDRESGNDDEEDGIGLSGEGRLLLLGGLGDGESLLRETNGGMVDGNGITLLALLARGKFASVYEGRITSLSDQPFALKCFGKENKEFFENERFVFTFLRKNCNHDNVIKYHGWQEFTVGPTTHLILVLDKICPGSLRDFLQSVTSSSEGNPPLQRDSEHNNEANDIDGRTAFKVADVLNICSGIACGLSYLHGENRDEIVIAHRDLTSKNILLDASTLTPKITDFGLSLVTRGSKYYWAGRERQAEFCSLAEAGTLRYMAPELLEGAVNLKDCENALKQADVYALALILWEVANCSPDVRLTQMRTAVTAEQQRSDDDATTGPDVVSAPGQHIEYLSIQHSLPYDEEIGKDNLSMDALSRHVVQYRQRPHFRRWRDSPYTRQLRDTLIESWDAEPDARLTALCIVERLHDIRNIRLKNSDLSKGAIHQSGPGQALQSPLESPTGGLYSSDGTGIILDSPWTGRNPCLQRNLLANNTTTSSSGGTHSSEGLSTSGSILSDTNGVVGLPAHPLLLNHFDLAKNQANLNFYHNYVGGSSGGTSYTGSTTGGATEVSNISSVTDERVGVTGATTRCPSAPMTSSQNSAVGTSTPHHPLPPTIPFLQNLHN